MNRITDLDKLLDGYRLSCLAEARQPKTVAWYSQKLSYFRQYLVSTNHSLDVTTIGPEDIRAFLTHLRTEVKKDALNPYKPAQTGQLSPLTVQGYARTLKAFFSWLVRDEHIISNRMKLVKMPDCLGRGFERAPQWPLEGLLQHLQGRSESICCPPGADYVWLACLAQNGVNRRSAASVSRLSPCERTHRFIGQTSRP